MSGCLNFSEEGRAVCKIGKRTLFVNEREVDGGTDVVVPKGDAVVVPVPDKDTERSVIYVTGASGSGKSYWTRNYIAEYHKAWPTRAVYIFSSLDEDSSLDSLKYIKRIKLRGPAFLTTELTTGDFASTLCIFDDCDVISSKPIKLKVYQILNSILETGRHFAISCIMTSHCACAGLETKRILNESHQIVIFPRSLGGRTSKYLLDGVLGMDREEIKRVKGVKSRWCSIVKGHPMLLLSEHEVSVLR